MNSSMDRIELAGQSMAAGKQWHPAAIDPGVDYSQEPTTLVVFELQEAETGTLLSVVETGFDRLPAERRAAALRMNSGGWDEQMLSNEKHLRA